MKGFDRYPWIDFSELNRCVLCHEAPCTAACPRGILASDSLRSLYFLNGIGALERISGLSCEGCDAPCEKACVLNAKSYPVRIKWILNSLRGGGREYFEDLKDKQESDLSTEVCGVPLENPFLLSSSVVASSYEMCAKAFSAGWAGASFKTICNFPQHEASPRFSSISSHSNSFCGFKNIEQLSDHSVEENMEVFRRLKKDFPTKVIIASIMGQDEEEWTTIAAKCQDAGADLIECNFSCPNMENRDLGSTIGQDPVLVERFTAAVRRGTSLPILAKLTPNVADMVPVALAARRGGANGISAINTLYSITGVDIMSFVTEPEVHGHTIVGGYSGQAVKPIALRFISDLSRSHGLKGMSLSGMGGIENWWDALEFLVLGASSLQVTTAVMQYGYRIIEDLVSGLDYYMRAMGFRSIPSLVGIARDTVVEHNELERDTVLLPRFNQEQCIGCGRCSIACYDGGHQAIEFDLESRKPKLIGSKCVGCHLCRLVCPSKAIDVAPKRISRMNP